MSTLARDLRFGVRMLLRNAGFSAAAVACLALGIGATTAIFSVVNAVVLKPLPYRQPERLLRLYTEFTRFPGGGLRKFWTSAPELQDLRRELKAFDSVEAWYNQGANLGANEPVWVTASFITGGMLRTLGVQPALGRLLTPADDTQGAPRAAVISYGLWQRAFGGDRNITARTAKLNGKDVPIVGVMPPGFQFPPGEADPPEIWVAAQIDYNRPRANHFLYLLARTKQGLSFEQARQDVDRAVAVIGRGFSQKNHVLRPEDHPLVVFPLHEEVVGNVRRAMVVLLAAVVFVLLIACVNVADLLLARSETRRREIAVRRALGAGTPILLKQFLIEGVLLAGLGAALGIALAAGGLRFILRVDPASIPRVGEIGIDWRVLLFTAGVSVLTGVLFGLAPLAQVTSARVADALKSAAGRVAGSLEGDWMRRVMVAGELALALVLLIGAGLMVRAFWKLQSVEVGLRPERVLTMRLALLSPAYRNEDLAGFWQRLQERLSAIPGVESATIFSGLPPARPLNANDTEIENFVPRPGGPIQNIDFYQLAGDRFFQTLGIRLQEGRFFDDRDGANAPPAVIVNRTLAERFWPGQSALGRRVRLGPKDPWRTIVGVVGDVKNAGTDKPPGTELFFPYRQIGDFGFRSAYIGLLARGEPRALANAARREIAALDPSLPVAEVRTMEDVLARATSRPRLLTLLLAIFSAVALALAAVGIYGVISYSVAQRTNEFGIRMAMGAQGSDVLGLVLRQGLTLGAFGIAAGALGAFLLTRFMRGMLFGIDSLDPATFAAMAAALGAVAVLAAFIPALRATRVDPIVALRYE